MLNIKSMLLITFLLQATTCAWATGEADIKKAEQYLNERDYRKASWIYMHAIEENVYVIEAKYGLAKINYQKQCYDAANKMLDEVLLLDTNHVGAHIMRSYIFVYQQKWQQALTELQILKGINRNNPEIYQLLDGVYAALGDQEASQQAATTYKEMSGQR